MAAVSPRHYANAHALPMDVREMTAPNVTRLRLSYPPPPSRYMTPERGHRGSGGDGGEKTKKTLRLIQ